MTSGATTGGETTSRETTGDESTSGMRTGDETVDSGTDTAQGRHSAGRDGRDVRTDVEWAAFAVLTTVALVATFRFYTTASRAIESWFSADYVPVLRTVLDLVLSLVAGISVVVRRMRGERPLSTL